MAIFKTMVVSTSERQAMYKYRIKKLQAQEMYQNGTQYFLKNRLWRWQRFFDEYYMYLNN